jgi:hypothetical protein
MFHGQGILTFPDGSTYEGKWKEDKFCGGGVLTLPDGSKHDGEWSGNKFKFLFKKEKRHVKGVR